MPALYIVAYFFTAISVSSVAAFIILLIGKLGIREQITLKAPKLISKLFECDFCLSFWTSLVLALAVAIFTNDIIALFMPLMAAPITRLLI